MADAGLDVLIAYAVKNQPGPVAYLCGYEPRLGLHDVAFFVVAPGTAQPYILVTNSFWDQAQERPGPGDTVIGSDFGHVLADLIPLQGRNQSQRVGIAGYRCFPAPNVWLTPHIAGVSSAYWTRIVDLFCDNLQRYLTGQELHHVVMAGARPAQYHLQDRCR